MWNYDAPDRRQQSRTVSPITPMSGDGPLAIRTSFDDAARSDGTASPSGLKRTKAKRLSRAATSSPVSQRPSRQITLDDPIEFVDEPKQIQTRQAKMIEDERQPRRKSTKRRGKNFSVWMPGQSEADYSDESDGSGESAEEGTMSPPGSPPSPPTSGRHPWQHHVRNRGCT